MGSSLCWKYKTGTRDFTLLCGVCGVGPSYAIEFVRNIVEIVRRFGLSLSFLSKKTPL
jgi:hypothetical protein